MLLPTSEQETLEELRRMVWRYLDTVHPRQRGLTRVELGDENSWTICHRQGVINVSTGKWCKLVTFCREGRIRKRHYYRFYECVLLLDFLNKKLLLDSLADI